jgi:imidazole glycerol-phosphate synthase subunit HisH
VNVAIINYGMGNLASVRRAFEECGAEVMIAEHPEDLDHAGRIVLPGVGSFAKGMENLHAAGWPQKLQEVLQDRSVALLGICLGMQLLAEKGYEGGENAGLGFIKGEVKLMLPVNGERIPHVGWNEVSNCNNSQLFLGIPDRTDFYFVHSYQLLDGAQDQIAGTTPYCAGVVSAVETANVCGAQFHPEKSSKPGFKLLRNFLEWQA